MSSELVALRSRVEELETQMAFQEELQLRLDDTVARQDRELLELKRQLKALVLRLDEMRDAGGGSFSAADEVPPHY